MPIKLNPRLDRADFARHHGSDRHYIESLRRRGLLIEIDNILADADQLVLRTFQCNTNYCVRCTRSEDGREYKGSCCTDLQVDLAQSEVDGLVNLARQARDSGEFEDNRQITKIIDRLITGKMVESNDDHELLLRHRKNGSCAMSWFEDDGQLRCSINTMAWALGIPIEEVKPGPCFLFPLHYAEYDRGKYIVSVLSQDTQHWIEQHKSVGKLKCLRKPEPGSPPAYQFLRGELEYVFGKKFYQELDKRAAPILEEYLTGIEKEEIPA